MILPANRQLPKRPLYRGLPQLTSPLAGEAGRGGCRFSSEGQRPISSGGWVGGKLFFPRETAPPHPGPTPQGGRGRFGRVRPRRSRGFSLIELLLVLLLIGIMAGVAGPAVGHFLDTLEFKKQTEKVMATIRYSRLMAITHGKLVLMTATEDEDSQALSLSGAVEEVKPLGLAEGATLELDPSELMFSPEGYATPGRLTLTSGGRSETITIDPLTALPLLEGAGNE
jgi:type II secretion system protein H